jgi:hypothetical protein
VLCDRRPACIGGRSRWRSLARAPTSAVNYLDDRNAGEKVVQGVRGSRPPCRARQGHFARLRPASTQWCRKLSGARRLRRLVNNAGGIPLVRSGERERDWTFVLDVRLKGGVLLRAGRRARMIAVRVRRGSVINLAFGRRSAAPWCASTTRRSNGRVVAMSARWRSSSPRTASLERGRAGLTDSGSPARQHARRARGYGEWGAAWKSLAQPEDHRAGRRVPCSEVTPDT